MVLTRLLVFVLIHRTYLDVYNPACFPNGDRKWLIPSFSLAPFYPHNNPIRQVRLSESNKVTSELLWHSEDSNMDIPDPSSALVTIPCWL